MWLFNKKPTSSTFDLTMYPCIRMHLRLTFPSPQMFTHSGVDFLHLSQALYFFQGTENWRGRY